MFGGWPTFSKGVFYIIGGADNTGFTWLSVSLLDFEIKNIFTK